MLLTANVGEDLIAVKSGFASGYGGQGPRTLSIVITLLYAHGAEIGEYEVSEDLMDRLDSSALTRGDIDSIRNSMPNRASSWFDYIWDEDWDLRYESRLWQRFKPVIPFSIIDPRLVDLAMSFWEDPDDRLFKAHRRLEEIVRARLGVKENGQKLFSIAFSGSESKLLWEDVVDAGEQAGRLNLFTGAYMAHRNPRAHRELKSDMFKQLSEFLLINHLYCLERLAVERPVSAQLAT